MAAAKPVVATRGGGIPEIVLEGETGLLVPMGDEVAMADAIIALVRLIKVDSGNILITAKNIQASAKSIENNADKLLPTSNDFLLP